MTLQLLHSEFHYIWGKFYFHFYQCGASFAGKKGRNVPPPHWHLWRITFSFLPSSLNISRQHMYNLGLHPYPPPPKKNASVMCYLTTVNGNTFGTAKFHLSAPSRHADMSEEYTEQWHSNKQTLRHAFFFLMLYWDLQRGCSMIIIFCDSMRGKAECLKFLG